MRGTGYGTNLADTQPQLLQELLEAGATGGRGRECDAPGLAGWRQLAGDLIGAARRAAAGNAQLAAAWEGTAQISERVHAFLSLSDHACVLLFIWRFVRGVV